MRLLCWIGLVWLGYVFIGYPLFLGLLGLVRRICPVIRDDFLPTVSVLIAARNEEKDIGWKVTETLQWEYPPERLEVLVASDASEDRTDEIVHEIKDPRLTFLRMEQRGGKNVALNCLAQLARGELLFFTDANAHIEPDCLRWMVRHFADERVGCVTGDSYSVREKANPAVGTGASVYWGYESVIRHLEAQIGSVLVCDGAIFCARRSLYSALLPELANDLELPLQIGHAGYWIRHEPRAQVLEKDTRSPWEEFARRRRICAQGMRGMWKLRKTLNGLRGWQFASHKFLRWLILIPLLLVLSSTIGLANEPLFAALLGLQTIFYGLALTGWVLALGDRSGSRLFSVPFYILLVSMAGLVGVVDACLGRRFAVWEIPALSRGRQGATWQKV